MKTKPKDHVYMANVSSPTFRLVTVRASTVMGAVNRVAKVLKTKPNTLKGALTQVRGNCQLRVYQLEHLGAQLQRSNAMIGLRKAAEPLVNWMRLHGHPHSKVIIDFDAVVFEEESIRIPYGRPGF